MTAPFRSPPPSGSRRTRPRRAGRPRWGLRITAGCSLLLLAAGGIGHALITGVEDGIARVDAFKNMGARPTGGGGTNFLIAGTDGREKLTAEQKREYHLGGEPCHCTDTLMLVHLSADRDRSSVISIPRDSYAEAPDHTDETTGERHGTHPIKINAAYAEGGPNLTTRTVEHMTGVHIDHYLEISFISFMKTVDAVGGVDICTLRPMRDSYTGLDLPVGTHRLNGGQALQYVRSRHIDGAADLGRMQRQQRFLAALVHRITHSGVLLNPIRFKKVSGALLGSVRADSGFGGAQLLALAQAMRGFGPSSSEFTSVPIGDVSYEVKNAGATVRWNEAKARELFAAVREDRPLAVHRPRRAAPATVDVAPEQIRVQVDNATRTPGLARRTDRALRATGFDTTGTPGDAPATGARRTVIAYDPRWDRSARSLAAALPGAERRAVPDQGPVLRVTVGADRPVVRRVHAQDSPPQGAGEFAAITGDQAVCP